MKTVRAPQRSPWPMHTSWGKRQRGRENDATKARSSVAHVDAAADCRECDPYGRDPKYVSQLLISVCCIPRIHIDRNCFLRLGALALPAQEGCGRTTGRRWLWHVRSVSSRAGSLHHQTR
eukprot:2665579-Prymnesium_polylepis.1